MMLSQVAANPPQQLFDRLSGRRLKIGAIIFFIFLAAYFGWLASEFNVQFYDSFQYLNCAKALAGLNSYYEFVRPPMMAIIALPLMLLYRFTGAIALLTRAPYFFSLAINAISLFLCWRLLRAGLKAEIALIMIALLSIDRVVFHYLPFLMPDIVAMGIVAAMAYSCHRLARDGNKRDAILTGVWLGLAVATKYYLSVLSLTITLFLFLEWFARVDGKLRFRPQARQMQWLIVIAISSAAVFLIIHKTVFFLIPESRNEAFFTIMLRNYQSAQAIAGLGKTSSEIIIQSAIFTGKLLMKSLSLPMLLVAALGLIFSIKRGGRMARLMTLIAITHLLTQTIWVIHKEARYFLQIFPMIFYFVGFALECGWQQLNASRSRQFVLAGLLAMLIGFILQGTIIEIDSFADKSYRNDLLIRMSHYIREHTNKENKVCWIGEPLTISPASDIFVDGPTNFKEYFYYQFQSLSNGLEYYSDRRGYALYPFTPAPPWKGKLSAGDLFFIGPNLDANARINIYPFQQMLYFQRASELDAPLHFIEAATHAKLSAASSATFQLQGGNRAYLIWEIMLRNQQRQFMEATPLPPAPAISEPFPAIAKDDVDGLFLIPCDAPINSFDTE